MIDNLQGLARTFDRLVGLSSPERLTNHAERLCHADMGAAAVQQYMPEWYHKTVNEAKRWLREHAALDASLA